MVALIEPVTAAGIALLLLHERLTMAAVAGSTILLGAVVVLTIGERRGDPAPGRTATSARPMLPHSD
ncbi:hypothetical protein [Micromonospora endophytica]|uniref:hypothetical protein n=1 Tax=Micromonospora endophytica TaxID=515350 RepID=UPI0015E8C351|nr:hypothetical protein [Micromonospora endophytica]